MESKEITAEDYDHNLEFLIWLSEKIIEMLKRTTGSGGRAIAFNTGRELGIRAGIRLGLTSEIDDALAKIQEFPANFARFEASNKKGKIELVFEECLIRDTIFKGKVPEDNPLCDLHRGFFSGAIKQMTGQRAKVDFISIGRACVKELIVL